MTTSLREVVQEIERLHREWEEAIAACCVGSPGPRKRGEAVRERHERARRFGQIAEAVGCKVIDAWPLLRWRLVSTEIVPVDGRLGND